MNRQPITSRQNPHVKQAAALRTGRTRKHEGKFLIDGARELARAIAAGVRIVEAFVCQPLCRTGDSQTAIEMLAESGARVFDVTPQVFEKLAFGNRADGILGVAETPVLELDDIRLPECPLVAVLEGVEKPGNVGAILRSADAAGVSAVVVADGGTDLYNPNTIRASLGAIFALPVCAATAQHTLTWLRRNQFQIVAARPDAETSYTSARYTGPTAIVLGAEARGLTQVFNGAEVTTVKIPMHGVADSLNVSVTAAVLFYEALRQRG